jgi:large repetitive protein
LDLCGNRIPYFSPRCHWSSSVISGKKLNDQALNGTDPESDPLTYTFELYADAGLTTLVASASNIPQAPTITSWPVPVTLMDNTHYYWRAKASDPYETGPWMPPTTFFVNLVNEPPTAPTLANPPDGSQVASRSPRP